jgi:AcrR family transcriptional regulator
MPREFTDAERERIRERLRETGRDLFARYGLAKTTIADLTDPAGVADSTFYTFYDSKEALYLELLEEEGEAIADRVVGASFERHDDPERAIAAFLRTICEAVETDPLVRRLVVEDELDRLRDRLSDAELAADRQQSVGYFLPYVEAWHEAGRLRGPDPETVAHAIRAVTFLTLHEEDVGEERYAAVRDLLVDAVAAGLATPADGSPADG